MLSRNIVGSGAELFERRNPGVCNCNKKVNLFHWSFLIFGVQRALGNVEIKADDSWILNLPIIIFYIEEKTWLIEKLHRAGDVILKRLLNFWMHNDTLFNLSPTGREFYRALKQIHSFCINVSLCSLKLSIEIICSL